MDQHLHILLQSRLDLIAHEGAIAIVKEFDKKVKEENSKKRKASDKNPSETGGEIKNVP